MPRGNGQGPQGAGRMTGRAAGFCAGNGQPGFMQPANGRGLGLGCGRKRGNGLCRNLRGVPSGITQPAHTLSQQAAALQAQLNALRARIATQEKQ